MEQEVKKIEEAEVPAKELEEYGKLLIEKIQKEAPKASIALLMSWPFQDKPEDLTRIAAAYRKLAKDTRVKLVPLGEVWKGLGSAYKDRELYYDRYSPTGLGQSVNACAIYFSLTGKRVVLGKIKFPGLRPKRVKADGVLLESVWKLLQ